jgi:hypothetical protein
LTQKAQVFMHHHFIERILDSHETIAPPLALRILEELPRLRTLPARMIGIGFRPEHVEPTKE